MHSYGRLIPVNFLVTEPEQIEGPDGVGRVNCTTSGMAANFQNNLTMISAVTGDKNAVLHQIKSDSTATLIVKNIRRAKFKNRQIFCNSLSHFFFLHLSEQGEWTRDNGLHS